MNSLISGSGYSPYFKPYPPATYPMPAPPPSRTPREGSRSRSASVGQKKSKLKLHRVGKDSRWYWQLTTAGYYFLCEVIIKSVLFQYTYLAHSEPAVAHKVQVNKVYSFCSEFL